MPRIIFIFIFIAAIFTFLYFSLLKFWFKWKWKRTDLDYERERLVKILKNHEFKLTSLSVSELELITDKLQLIENSKTSPKITLGYCHNIYDEIIAVFLLCHMHLNRH